MSKFPPLEYYSEKYEPKPVEPSLWDIGWNNLSGAFESITLALRTNAQITSREIYSINRLKRAFHRFEVHARRLRKKHSKVRGRKAKK